ncbi:MAG: YceI family protein [Candidatus Acidiferrales bacterium]
MPIRRRAVPRWALSLAVLQAVSVFAAPAFAQGSVFTLDPAQTEIHFTLDTTLHTVHGTFKLKSGAIRFDLASGKASGAIIVDATSGDSSSSGRDKKMHKEILESPTFSEIVFTPTGVQGAIAPEGASQVAVAGVMKLHGQDHEVTLHFAVQPGAAGRVQATTHFSVPYVKWGLKNPSSFILHADDTVDIDIQANGQITPVLTSH